jgi:hypothetical protein
MPAEERCPDWSEEDGVRFFHAALAMCHGPARWFVPGLFAPCPTCRGDGSPGGEVWRYRFAADGRRVVDLGIGVCPTCGGEGVVPVVGGMREGTGTA